MIQGRLAKSAGEGVAIIKMIQVHGLTFLPALNTSHIYGPTESSMASVWI